MSKVGRATGPVTVYRDLEGDPVNDLAFEGDLLEHAGSGRSSLFVYSWTGPVVVVGYGQKAEGLDLQWCRDHNVPVYRRISGGTGVVHTRDLAISLFLTEEHQWAAGIIALYQRFLGVLEPALVRAGGEVERTKHAVRAARVRSPICFEDQLADTLVSGGRKVVGCAQARRSGGVLIHALVSLNLDVGVYASVFKASEERIRRGLGQAIPGGVPATVGDEIAASFVAALGATEYTEVAPRASAGRLAEYTTDRWCLAE